MTEVTKKRKGFDFTLQNLIFIDGEKKIIKKERKEEKFCKVLKIPEINIVLCDFSAQQIREDAYLSRDPQWGTRSPKPRSDQSVKPAAAPATEGIPLRNICFFVLVRK